MLARLIGVFSRFAALVLGIVLLLGSGSLPVAAGQPVTVLVQLAGGADAVQLSLDHGASVAGAIDALAIYRLQGADPALLDKLRADPRVVVAEEDRPVATFEVRQQYFGASSSDFEALQQYFGASSSDFRALQQYFGASSGGGAPEWVLVAGSGHSLEQDWKDWGLRQVRAEQAQRLSLGAGVVVAVLDTGVDLDHPALAGHLLPGFDFVEADSAPGDEPNGLDDDEDGRVDEGTGHGTHVAGIVAAVAPQARILPVRVLNSDGGGTLFNIVDGLVYAVAQGAQVINLSLSAEEHSPLFEAAVNYALDRQVVVVAAAAGSGATLEYPASYPGVTAVGATQRNNRVADFSDFRADQVRVFAPGEMVYSTYYDGGYAWWSGTSMAAPFVSGEAALLLAGGACNAGCVAGTVEDAVRPVVPNLEARGRIDLYDAVKTVAGR